MREAFFILLVIAVLFILTALRYRRQIASVIMMWRAVRDASRGTGRPPLREGSEAGDVDLVMCAKCGKWVPSNRTISLPTGARMCSSDCTHVKTRND